MIEARVASPLMPLGLFRHRNLAASNIVGVLWAAAMFAWFFLSALYLQLVLGYSPLQVGLAFLPANLIMGAFSIGLSAKLVMRFGIRLPLAVGLGLAGARARCCSRARRSTATSSSTCCPGMILLGIGAGMAFNPVLLAAMGDVEPSEAGLASGVVNTSFMMGGALGLAVLASLAASRTDSLLASGEDELEALNGGYHVAFLVGAVFAAAAEIAGLLLRPRAQQGRVAAHAEVATELRLVRGSGFGLTLIFGNPRSQGTRRSLSLVSAASAAAGEDERRQEREGDRHKGDVPHETSSHQAWVRAVRRDGFSSRGTKRRQPPVLLPWRNDATAPRCRQEPRQADRCRARSLRRAGPRRLARGGRPPRHDVGIGTLYRHFPSRETLAEEIFAEHIEEVIAAAEAAAAAEDAWIGLVSFLEQVLGLQARNLPLRGLFLRHGGGPGIAERRRLIFPLLEQLVERAREQRVVRDDLTVGDLSLAMWSFAPVLEATAGIAPNVWRRHLRILLDGMRPDAATQQEVAPLAGRRLERAIDTLRERYHRRRIAA